MKVDPKVKTVFCPFFARNKSRFGGAWNRLASDWPLFSTSAP